MELEEELKVVGNSLKSLEVSEEKANQRVEEFKKQLKSLTVKLKEAEARAEYAEKTVKKLQKEVDRLEGTIIVSVIVRKTALFEIMLILITLKAAFLNFSISPKLSKAVLFEFRFENKFLRVSKITTYLILVLTFYHIL